MVRDDREAEMESSRLCIRPRLDDTFCDDGHRSMARMARMEARRIQGCQDSAHFIRHTTCSECCLVLGFFPFPSTRMGLRRNPSFMVCDRRNNNRIF